MSRYDYLKSFNRHQSGIYLPYVMLGFPTIERSFEICKILIEEGVHGLELGFPFRDPVADGPTLQQAAGIALDNGFKLDDGVDLVRRIRSLNAGIPLTGMSYYNMINTWGPGKFLSTYAKAGLDGLLVPDLPPDCAGELEPLADRYGLHLIFIASPNTPTERLELIAQKTSAFTYVVTKLGVTGTDSDYDRSLSELFEKLHKFSNQPTIAGFGISRPRDARQMMNAGADGVIVGSKLVELAQNFESPDAAMTIRKHTKAMLCALDDGPN